MPRPGRPEDAEGVAEVYLAAQRSHGQEQLGSSDSSAASQSSALGADALAHETQRYAELLRMGEQHFLVAEEGDDSAAPGLRGFVSYGPSCTQPAFGEVMQLCVHPEWQGRGIGSGLLQGAWDAMSQHTWAAAGIHAWGIEGSPASQVYAKAGWAPTGHEKRLQPSLSSKDVMISEYCAPASRFPSASPTARTYSCTVAAAAAVAGLALALAAWPWRGGHEAPPKAKVPNVGRVVRVEPMAVGVPGARCLDGSQPLFYHRAAPAGRVGERRWLLHFQGGGWCVPGAGAHTSFPPTLIERCGVRAATPKGSTRSDGEWRNLTDAIFSQDEGHSPVFHDWHAVYLRYCDGASFADAAGVASLRAILRTLLALGLSAATDIVVSGCSAGAVAAALHAGAVQRAVPGAFVTALVDSGVFPDWSRPVPGNLGGASDPPPGQPPPDIWPVDAELRRAFAERNLEAAGALPPPCVARYAGAAWKCMFLEHLLPVMEVPAFILQSRFDSSNVRGIDNASSLEAFGASVAWRMARALEESDGRHALFLDSCFHHCMSWGGIFAKSLAALHEAPVAQPAAFAAWWHHQRARWYSGARGQDAGAAQPLWRWDHRPGSGSRPCWEASCCPDWRRDLDFWRPLFSEAARAGEARAGAGAATR
mmetsp:Transcript_22752/g.72023  ORF Transcript_22752/g.72023 Transcript_22752/m.72023 type:complete len:649 (-) Transcript_22752:46-1992(-)